MISNERRNRFRFPLDGELRFQVIRRGQGRPAHGVGYITDMSSKGLAFRTDVVLTPGMRLSASMVWPALLDQTCRLRLTLEGTVVRTQGDLVVLGIESHDFRTTGKSGMAAEEVNSLAREIAAILPSRLQ